MKKARSYLILFILFFQIQTSFTQIPENIQKLIKKGEFSEAQQQMRIHLVTNLEMDASQKQEILFEIERLARIKKDFTRSEKYILNYVKKYIPDATVNDLKKWEDEKSLEYWVIDGEKRYFKWAPQNLFRINKKLKKIKKEKDGPAEPPIYNRLEDVREIIKEARTTGKKFVNPVQVKVTYKLTVKKDVVPGGKIIRCWLPFPREIPQRQTNVKLLSSQPDQYIIANNEKYLQRTIYMEQPAKDGGETPFEVVFEFTNHAVFQPIDPDKVIHANITSDLLPFISERPPHVVFSDKLKKLNKKIVGKEKNPYRIARKIFKYINDNIPWASAREYSTFYNISDYVYRNKHCDCGMHSIFFITMCRMNGIPARWQSGWTTKPGGGGMHDWGEIYFEPYGWLPVDADIGLLDSKDETVKWFFLGGMDAYRLIVNDEYSQTLFPAKIHFRSETIDFQRGEVEWEGGNLYFDQWYWDYKIELKK